MSELIPDLNSPSLVLLDTTQKPALPLPLRIGDFNMDGHPDLLVVVAHRGGIQAKLLESLPCGPHHKECSVGRTFRSPAKGSAALDAVLDVRVASFFDIDDDVSLGSTMKTLGTELIHPLLSLLASPGLPRYSAAEDGQAVGRTSDLCAERLLQRCLLP